MTWVLARDPGRWGHSKALSHVFHPAYHRRGQKRTGLAGRPGHPTAWSLQVSAIKCFFAYARTMLTL